MGIGDYYSESLPYFAGEVGFLVSIISLPAGVLTGQLVSRFFQSPIQLRHRERDRNLNRKSSIKNLIVYGALFYLALIVVFLWPVTRWILWLVSFAFHGLSAPLTNFYSSNLEAGKHIENLEHYATLLIFSGVLFTSIFWILRNLVRFIPLAIQQVLCGAALLIAVGISLSASDVGMVPYLLSMLIIALIEIFLSLYLDPPGSKQSKHTIQQIQEN